MFSPKCQIINRIRIDFVKNIAILAQLNIETNIHFPIFMHFMTEVRMKKIINWFASFSSWNKAGITAVGLEVKPEFRKEIRTVCRSVWAMVGLKDLDQIQQPLSPRVASELWKKHEVMKNQGFVLVATPENKEILLNPLELMEGVSVAKKHIQDGAVECWFDELDKLVVNENHRVVNEVYKAHFSKSAAYCYVMQFYCEVAKHGENLVWKKGSNENIFSWKEITDNAYPEITSE